MTTTEERLATLRARVPAPLLPGLIAARARLAWRRASVREDARAQMRFLLEHTRPEADIEAAARAYVRFQARRGELRWHPDQLASLPVVGLEHLVAARDAGAGVVLSFVHHGFYEGAFASIARRGVPGHLVAYPYMLEPDAPLWLRQHVRVSCLHGGTPVSAAIGSDGIRDLLRQGHVVAIATDVPGRTPMRFAGREVLGSFGAARLAGDTGSPVVAVSTEFDERGAFIRLHEPLHTAAFESPRELLAAMLAIHERVLVRWPEATDIPLARWTAADSEVARV